MLVHMVPHTSISNFQPIAQRISCSQSFQVHKSALLLVRQRRCMMVTTGFKFSKKVVVTDDIIASDPESTMLYTPTSPEYTPPHDMMYCFEK